MNQRTPEEIKEIRADVAARYPKHEFPDVVLEPLWWGRRPTNRVADRFAIVDQRQGHVYNVCTDIYKPVYHEEIIFMCEEAANKLPEFGKPVIKVNLLQNGGKLDVKIAFPEVKHDINPKVGDFVSASMDVFSSYDLGWKYGGRMSGDRLSCSNGMTVGQLFDSFKKRHLTSLDPQELMGTLEAGMLKFSEQTDLWKRWANEAISAATYEELWTELPFSTPEKEKMEQLTEMGSQLLLPAALKSGSLTRWDFFNVTTQYVTHNINSEIRRIEILPTITKVFEKYH